MSRRTALFCVFALLAAAVFVRLGLWQVARLRERQAHNQVVIEQQRNALVPLARLPRDSTARYRGASADGRFDYEHEIVLASRTNNGSPGVDLLTPLRLPGTDTAVLVNRGWVYSPDGGTVDLGRWRESESAHVEGYVETFSADAGATNSTTNPRLVRRVSRQEVAAKIPYPVAPWYLVSRADTAAGPHPVRRSTPSLDEGPHRSYAMQWFFFAAIALGGAAAVAFRERASRSIEETSLVR
jgi:surfeit locus 1 family protein